MTWLLIEALLALVLALFIVWWTMKPGRRRRDADDTRPRDPDGRR